MRLTMRSASLVVHQTMVQSETENNRRTHPSVFCDDVSLYPKVQMSMPLNVKRLHKFGGDTNFNIIFQFIHDVTACISEIFASG